MTDIFKAIADNGIAIVLAGAFIWVFIYMVTTINVTLTKLSESNDNIAKVLELLKITQENSITLLRQHDERSISIKEQLNEIVGAVSGCKK